MSVTGLSRPHRLWAWLGVACLAVFVLAVNPAAARASIFPGFETEASQFQLYYDCEDPPEKVCPGHGSVADVSSPVESPLKESLDIDYQSGNPQYMGLDAYIPLGTDASATRYQINYDFYFPDKAPVQALEFCMNNYFGGERYQWAMQYENIGSGAPQWRLWTGTAWQAIGVPDTGIDAGTWYTLTIDGDIVAGKVHYMDFIIAGTEHNLSQYTFSPQAQTGPGLVAAVQLDGNIDATPYNLYIDNAHYYWSN
jgi:hypothetical protein